MEEMHVRAVDLGGVLRKLIQVPLGRTPVVGGAPVAGQVFEIAQRRPPLPADAGQLGRPAGVFEPAVQVVQIGLRDIDTEWLHRLLLITSGGLGHPVRPRRGRPCGRADPGPGRATASRAPSGCGHVPGFPPNTAALRAANSANVVGRTPNRSWVWRRTADSAPLRRSLNSSSRASAK